MNYFNHVNYFYDLVALDKRLQSHHICIYMVLLHIWNKNRFIIPFYAKKKTIMYYARIGSAHTYYKRLKELHSWGYFSYESGKNAIVQCQFYMIEFTEESVQNILNNSSSANSTQVQKYTGVNMQRKKVAVKKEIPPARKDVDVFFIDNDSNKTIAEKFYLYYSSLGWKNRNNRKIEDWEAAALLWIKSDYNTSSSPDGINLSKVDYNERL
jgi:hypothetical protein